MLDQAEIRAILSLGISTFQGQSASGNEVLKGADRAMYEAKASGRNRVIG
jgi:diguanylate cyclase (GGDEF)-like protein